MLNCIVDPVLLREMVLSIPLHMQNINVFPDNLKFKQCSHLQLPSTGRDKKWLQPNSLVIKKVSYWSFVHGI
jgi:hypothetical protein